MAPSSQSTVAFGAEDGLALLVHPADPAVGTDDPVLEDVGLPARHGFPHDLFDILPVVRVDDRRERPHTAPDEVRRREAGDRLDVVADELHVPVGVEVAPVHRAGDVRQQGPEPFLADTQVLEGLHPLRDVDQESLSDRVTTCVADEHRLVDDPDVRPVVPLQPVLHAEGLEGLASGGELLQDAIAVVGMDQLDEIGELPVGALLRDTQHTLQRRAEMDCRPVGADGVHGQGESLEDLRAGRVVSTDGTRPGRRLGPPLGRRSRHA